MPRRLTLLAVTLAIGALMTAGCAEQSAAVRVGDRTVSQSDFEAELDAFASSTAFVQDPATVEGALSGSFTQEFVAAALGQRIEFMLAERLFDERELELTDADIQTITEQVGPQLEDMPRDLRESLIEDLARRTRLLEELGEQEYGLTLTEAADATDIEVSSHYGTWNGETYSVDPPEGPAGA
jgi:hypothetical protein